MWTAVSAWLAKRGVLAVLGALKWKLIIGLVAIVLTYIGVLNLRLHWAKADLKAAEAEVSIVRGVNEANAAEFRKLAAAHKALADAVKLSNEQLEKVREDAKRAEQRAAQARQDLAREREKDRQAPDCAALLDRSLAVCPNLIRRLWPDAARPH